MRKILITVFLCASHLLLNAQQSKLNQAEPSYKKAGRSLKLKRIITVTDEQGGFFFRMPRDLKITPDGTFYLMDSNQLLQFSKNGIFRRNFYKAGQGPSELNMMKSYILYEDSILVFNSNPKKVVWFNRDGSFQKEIKIPHRLIFPRLLLCRNDKYYFYSSYIAAVKGKPRIVDVDYHISKISIGDNTNKKLISLPVKEYIDAEGSGWYSYSVGQFLAVAYQNRYLVISHTPDYLLKIYDVEKESITRIFSRKYKREPFNTGDQRESKAPKLKYSKDIKSIFARNDGIWVVTSTKDQKRGILIDLYDYNGSYLNNIYARINGEIIGIQKNHIFVKETGKDFNTQIVIYQIMDS